MTDRPELSTGELGLALKRFLDDAAMAAPIPEPFFVSRLSAHFDQPCTALPIVAEDLAGHEQVDLQRALDSYLSHSGHPYELLGVSVDHKRTMGVALGDLVASSGASRPSREPAREGPVDHITLDAGDGIRVACVDYGLYLLGGPTRLAVLVRGGDPRFGSGGVRVEVMALAREQGEAFLADLRIRRRRDSVYRGQVISLALEGPMGALVVQFHHLPTIDREEIVLPAGLLERIELQTTRFAALRDRLQAAGRHLRRGLLLWGPPGTGKTMVAMHLAGRMPDQTVLLLTGPTIGLLEATCRMARLLQPSTVVLEDVDLIAEERTRQGTGANALLFQLLNEMDGIGDDADVLFLLTTNRPELLEAALASRPGRVDEAIEVPLPDADCRRRLLERYGRGLVLAVERPDDLVARTDGVSAAFVKELLRKAAVRAAEADPGPAPPADPVAGATIAAGAPITADDTSGDTPVPITVTDEHLDRALHDLLVDGGALTRTLLGVVPGGTGRAAAC